MAQHKNLSAIFENKLFTGLEEKQINLKVISKDLLEFKEGDIIFMSGDKSEFLYLILEGEAKIKQPGARRLPQIDLKIKNDFFGEKELIEKTDRKSSVIANRDSIIFPLAYDKLLDLVKGNKKIKINLYKYSQLEKPEDLKEEENGQQATQEKEQPKEVKNLEPEEPIKKEEESNIEYSHPDTVITDQNIFTGENVMPIEDEVKESGIKPFTDFNLTEENKTINEIQDSGIDIKDEPGIEKAHKEIQETKHFERKEEGEHRFYDKYFGKYTEAFDNENIDNKKLSEILQALQRINSRLNVDEVVFSISDAIKYLTSSDECIVYIVNRDKYEISTKYKTETEAKEFVFKINETLSGIAVENYQIINIKNVSEDKRYSPEKENFTDLDVRSALYFPVTSEDGKVVAVLQLMSTEFSKYSDFEESILSIISIHAAQAIQNAMIIESALHEDRMATLSKVVSFLSNDIYQPIHNINEYIEKVNSNGQSSKLKPLFDLIKEKASSINNFSEALIHYSSEKYHMKEFELQFSNVINKILADISEYVESRNSKLYKKINADAMVNINPNAFHQAIYQIIKNGCDSMPEGGNVFVTVDKEEEQIVIEIKDLGLGVPESIKQEIFEPFMTQGKENGVGLGLAVTKKIVDDHKGKISVESDLGEGSRFKIFLPIVENIE